MQLLIQPFNELHANNVGRGAPYEAGYKRIYSEIKNPSYKEIGYSLKSLFLLHLHHFSSTFQSLSKSHPPASSLRQERGVLEKKLEDF